MSTSYNDTGSEERMALLHSIVTGRKISMGKIIVNETFKCIEMGTHTSKSCARGTNASKSIDVTTKYCVKSRTIQKTLASIALGAMPTFPTFPASLFAGDCSQHASPKINSSTPSNATEPFTPNVDESAKAESEEVQKKPHASSIPATLVDSANTQAASDPV
ncbi:hypothetical protein V6N12_012966 [Hibiscus sabdariffa]|uniref:Uncharacterized protein n=1 Tax=Hibiscus sabdariffa TaxID=183260 RepID=A0ABR2EFY2_9ROSI